MEEGSPSVGVAEAWKMRLMRVWARCGGRERMDEEGGKREDRSEQEDPIDGKMNGEERSNLPISRG